MGSFSQTTTPQIPPPHLLTRTLASPAWVSQIPFTSPPACAAVAGAASNAARIANMKPSLQAIESPQKAGLHTSKSGLCNAVFSGHAQRLRPCQVLDLTGGLALTDHLPQRVRRTEAAVPRPSTIMAAPTRANSVQAGASIEASHQPPIATIKSRAVYAITGPPTRAAPCDAKYRQAPMPKKTKAGPAQAK